MTGARVKWMIIAVLVSGLVAAAAAWLVTDWVLHRHADSHAHDHAQGDLHAWMHENLDLTPEQHDKLEPVEAAFEQKRAQLKEAIRLAGADLAAAIGAPEPDRAALDAALERLNKSQAELQRATIDHFFAMKRYLRPAQARKMVEWTHDSLARQP